MGFHPLLGVRANRHFAECPTVALTRAADSIIVPWPQPSHSPAGPGTDAS
jgi:hypothetical protein